MYILSSVYNSIKLSGSNKASRQTMRNRAISRERAYRAIVDSFIRKFAVHISRGGHEKGVSVSLSLCWLAGCEINAGKEVLNGRACRARLLLSGVYSRRPAALVDQPFHLLSLTSGSLSRLMLSAVPFMREPREYIYI